MTNLRSVVASGAVGVITCWCLGHADPVRGDAPTRITSGFFVDCDSGNDGARGNVVTAPWRTLAKVAGTAMSTGADVWIKAGTTCAGKQLVIDWSGTAADRAIVGSYYVADGVAYENTPTNPTAWPTAYTYTVARPQVTGSCAADSWTDSACKRKVTAELAPYVPDNDPANAVPGNWNAGLIEIRGNYVTLQDIKVYGSAGVGIFVQVRTPAVHDVLVQRMYTDHTFNAAMRAYIANNVTFRDSVMRYIATSDNPITAAPNPAAVNLANAHSGFVNNYLIEGNDIAQSFGGGIQLFYYPRSVIIRGNRLADQISNRPYIYGDDGDDIVIEYNTFTGGQWLGIGDKGGSRGVAFTYEAGNAAYVAANVPLTDLVVRGNMFAGTRNCFEMAQVYSGAQWVQSAKFYNNTCFAIDEAPVALGGALQLGTVEIKNNVLQSAASGTTLCNRLHRGVAPTWGYNLWNTLPATQCRGTGDVTGTAVVAGRNMGTKDSTTNIATPADFVLQPGSPGLAAGTPLSLKVLSIEDFPQSAKITYPCATFDVSGSVVDASCAPRSTNAPSLGALEGARGEPLDFGLTVE